MNAWNFVAGVVAGGLVSMISVTLGAAIATSAINGKKHDETERERYEKWLDGGWKTEPMPKKEF